MSEPVPSAVTYIGLPISSGGAHSLGGMSLNEAHRRTLAFLDACTETAPPVYTLRRQHGPRVVRHPVERELRRRFGGGWQVVVPSDRSHEAVAWMQSIAPSQPLADGRERILLTATATFRLLDPDSKSVMPGQDSDRYDGGEYEFRTPLGQSQLRLILGTHARLGIELCLPDVQDADLARIVPWLQSYLPCRLSSHHWKRWERTKSGSYRPRRMPAPPLM